MRPFTGHRLRTLAAAGVLTVTGAAGVAVTAVHAQQPSPTPAASQRRTQAADDFIARLAQNLGVSADKLRDALKQTALQEVDAAAARGDITAQQAQQAKDHINAGEVGPFGFAVGPGGFGPGGPGGRGFGVAPDQLAQFLGVTAQQLHTELDGKSLAQVAQAHGKSRDQLIQFLTTAAQQRLAADVQAGRLTQQQADQRLNDLKARIDQIVDRVHQPGQRPRQGSGGTQQ
jgi:uncharacterized protein YidB (DUF937 family)